ncbi:hypothetical protein ACHAO5_009290, partial [Verticillium nonalfalfae]
ATAEDEWALPEKKGKGGKGKQADKSAAAADDAGDDGGADDGEPGRVLTKAEKEKIKKEKEKQRKKEMVSSHSTPGPLFSSADGGGVQSSSTTGAGRGMLTRDVVTGCEEEGKQEGRR